MIPPGENTESLTLSLECHFSNYVLQLLVRPRHFYNYRGGILVVSEQQRVTNREILETYKIQYHDTYTLYTGVTRRTHAKHEFPEFQGKLPA